MVSTILSRRLRTFNHTPISSSLYTKRPKRSDKFKRTTSTPNSHPRTSAPTTKLQRLRLLLLPLPSLLQPSETSQATRMRLHRVVHLLPTTSSQELPQLQLQPKITTRRAPSNASSAKDEATSHLSARPFAP